VPMLPDGVSEDTIVETIDSNGRHYAAHRADKVNWNIELSEDGVWVSRWRFASPPPSVPTGYKLDDIETALNGVNHALMAMRLPETGKEKRAWQSLLDSQRVLTAMIAAAPPA